MSLEFWRPYQNKLPSFYVIVQTSFNLYCITADYSQEKNRNSSIINTVAPTILTYYQGAKERPYLQNNQV